MTLRCCLVAVALAAGARADQPALTVYNQNFGVVRERIPLTLQAGVNQIDFNEITAHLEPDSVVLRDPSGARQLQILEQNYRNDPISQGLLLSLYEGQTISFVQPDENAPGRERIIQGKLIRSGYTPPQPNYERYGWGPAPQNVQPLIEVDGQLRFGLPGTPLFPRLADDTILKPTLTWRLESDTAGPLTAELSYVTGGMSWQAAYNIIAPETGDQVDLIGWVTIDNQSGRTFREAELKLMAGDVSKLQPANDLSGFAGYRRLESKARTAPVVTEKAFDEYHLYTLARPTTLHDRETKQVEFVRATGIDSRRVYLYDGARNVLERYRGWDPQSLRVQAEIGGESDPDVWVVREFKNTKENQLGIPLPAGKARFYRADADGRHEFVGENVIDHTPKDELVRLYTGNAFDIVGERVRTNFQVNHEARWSEESLKITIRNHKTEAVTVRIVEHLFRWHTWQIKESSHTFEQKDASRIEFPVEVPQDGEVTVSYVVHYSW